jgi:hypothetical protein
MFDIKLEGIDEALKQFNPNLIIRAANSAINDVSKQGTNEGSRLISAEYNIKPTRIKKYLKLTSRARGVNMEAIITGKGLGIPRAYFNPKQEGVIANKKGFRYTKKAKKAGRGGILTTLIKRSHGRRQVPEKFGNKPFIIKTKSGHVGVFYRTANNRLPITPSFGPGIGGLFGTKSIRDGVIDLINDKFPARFNYWIDRYGE